METSQHYIKTQKTARYSTYGKWSEKTKYFWFVLHGSNMTCEQMLYKFSDFDENIHFVVAPEALNRFYANGFGGEAVASWMTSRDRLKEIADFSSYLSTLYKKYIDLLPSDCIKTIMGFSQGGTTMYRWLHNSENKADFIIPYSCWIPEDIDLKASKTKLAEIKSVYTYGLQDQFLSKETIDKVLSIAKENELNLLFEPYEGDHRVDRIQLRKIFENHILITSDR